MDTFLFVERKYWKLRAFSSKISKKLAFSTSKIYFINFNNSLSNNSNIKDFIFFTASLKYYFFIIFYSHSHLFHYQQTHYHCQYPLPLPPIAIVAATTTNTHSHHYQQAYPFFNFMAHGHTHENKPLDSHYLVLPWKTWISVSALFAVTDAFCRSNGTVNRRILSLLDVKASPNPNLVKGVRSSNIMVDPSRWTHQIMTQSQNQIKSNQDPKSNQTHLDLNPQQNRSRNPPQPLWWPPPQWPSLSGLNPS